MGASGVYHIAGSERVSRYDFATKIAETLELDKSLIATVKMDGLKVWVAKRPRDSSLSVDKIRRELEISPLSLNDALKSMKHDEKMFRLERSK